MLLGLIVLVIGAVLVYFPYEYIGEFQYYRAQGYHVYIRGEYVDITEIYESFIWDETLEHRSMDVSRLELREKVQENYDEYGIKALFTNGDRIWIYWFPSKDGNVVYHLTWKP